MVPGVGAGAGGDEECFQSRGRLVSTASDIEDLRVIMNVEVGDENGIDATDELVRRYPDLRVAVLTAHLNTAVVRRPAAAGHAVFCPRTGRSWRSSTVAGRPTGRAHGRASGPEAADEH